jgi:hypothetical protein
VADSLSLDGGCTFYASHLLEKQEELTERKEELTEEMKLT